MRTFCAASFFASSRSFLSLSGGEERARVRRGARARAHGRRARAAAARAALLLPLLLERLGVDGQVLQEIHGDGALPRRAAGALGAAAHRLNAAAPVSELEGVLEICACTVPFECFELGTQRAPGSQGWVAPCHDAPRARSRLPRDRGTSRTRVDASAGFARAAGILPRTHDHDRNRSNQNERTPRRLGRRHRSARLRRVQSERRPVRSAGRGRGPLRVRAVRAVDEARDRVRAASGGGGGEERRRRRHPRRRRCERQSQATT